LAWLLLDLDAGWLRFYRNGKWRGSGFTEGVTGPLVRAAALWDEGEKATALPRVRWRRRGRGGCGRAGTNA
jgi:hypothetical protein